ncbi:MAG: SAM-dependent methyltransferase [Gammaproteobacteria bacterium]|nr:SAM-dependent methyltransferase [Gammaproteobacteria bacterium]
MPAPSATPPDRPPLLTRAVHEQLREAARAGAREVTCSLDLGRTTTTVAVDEGGWTAGGRCYPWPGDCRDRTVYYWDGAAFEPVARFGTGLVKLVPTEWGPPTFEIDGIKMLPTAKVSPWDDAGAKVALVRPRGRVVLDTCGGLGYFAAWCLASGAARVLSFEKNPDVLWLRRLNPWSPEGGNGDTAGLELRHADITREIGTLGTASVDAILHDPPRFGIAGELYAGAFYAELARVLRPGGRLFHYTGTPNRLTTGRDVPAEVAKRLRAAGFAAEPKGDGVLAMNATGRR